MAFNYKDFLKTKSVESKVTLPAGRHRGLVKSITNYEDRILVNLETLDHKPIRQVASFNMSNDRGYELCVEFLSEVGGHQSTMSKNLQEALGKEVSISVTENDGYLNATVFALTNSVVEQPKPKRKRKTTTVVETVEETDVEVTEAELEELGI